MYRWKTIQPLRIGHEIVDMFWFHFDLFSGQLELWGVHHCEEPWGKKSVVHSYRNTWQQRLTRMASTSARIASCARLFDLNRDALMIFSATWWSQQRQQAKARRQNKPNK